LYLSKLGPEPGGEHGPRHFPKPFITGSKFQPGRNLVEDRSEVSACLQPARLSAGPTDVSNDFQPLHLFCSCVKEAQNKRRNTQ